MKPNESLVLKPPIVIINENKILESTRERYTYDTAINRHRRYDKMISKIYEELPDGDTVRIKGELNGAWSKDRVYTILVDE